MQRLPPDFPPLYNEALRAHGTQESRPIVRVLGDIGGWLGAAGMHMLELSKLHERIILVNLLPHCAIGKQAALIRKAGNFFAKVIAQALLGINVSLSRIKMESGINTKELVRDISLIRKMVTKSADTVHQFARDRHPAALDVHSLIPALHSFMKGFTTRIPVSKTTEMQWATSPP